MRTKIIVVSVCIAMFSLVACSRGTESKECVDYFAKVEACAAKASPMKADILRKSAALTKEGFGKNPNPMAIRESCKMMMETLKNDPDCK
ncbi:MAG: hypothetical protein FWD69_08350 [Polyangiaceae bacterium]|nr:hypothetical protein [Polyangiaceae bacterium]